jgi:hypothetical protein
MRRVLGVALLLAITASGCTGRRLPEPFPFSQLEIRAIQTRTYAGRDLATVLKTLLNVLQDDGFLVHYGDLALGLLDASKAVAGVDGGEFGLILPTRIFLEIVGGSPGVATVDATANVSEFGDRVRVRVNFQRRLVGLFGGVSVTPVTDPKSHQEFFTKLDKGLFLQGEGL